MKRNSRRFMALALSAVMAMGSYTTAYAAESKPDIATESEAHEAMEADAATKSEAHETPEAEATEGGDKNEIVQVILPTSAVEIFDFILDPQELIRQTNGAAYGGKTFEEGATLFFERSDGKAEKDYTSDSNAVTIANRGLTSVDVMVNANITVTMAEGLAMTDDREFTDDTRPSLYLALTNGETTVPITFEEGAGIQMVLPPAEDADGETACSFWLTGACNKNGDWSGLGDMGIEVTVTWKVVSREEEPSPESGEEQTPDDVEEATPSTVTPAEGVEATPSEATPSEADKEGNETPSKATASEAEKDTDETPPDTTASEVVKDVKKTTPKTADKDEKTAPPQEDASMRGRAE